MAFIGIPQPIWTYNSTEPSNVSCKVDVMVNMSRIGIFFNRSSKYPPESAPPSNLTPLALESLTFMSDDYSCAVLRVSWPFPGPFWYELRVRNTSITRGPTEKCLENFRNMSGTHRGVYNSSCQDILRGAFVH
uniref:p27 protein-like protein n=1 Tax=Amblyomma americanum TaxID=6943 RepID=B5M7B6_AMBAM